MEEELIPFIELRYRTHSFRILEGHSFGGLFAVYILMESPTTFDAFIIEAPALWWNGEEMTEMAGAFFDKNMSLNKVAYFGIGGGDGWGMRQELRRYVEVIRQNEPKGFRWKHEEVGDEDHMTSRLLLNYYGLKFLFEDVKASKELVEHFCEEDFLRAEQELKNRYGEKARRPASSYIHMATNQESSGDLSEAITVLKRAIEAYPRYIGLITYLARLYVETDQLEQAISTYTLGIEVSRKYKLGQEEDLLAEINKLKQ